MKLILGLLAAFCLLKAFNNSLEPVSYRDADYPDTIYDLPSDPIAQDWTPEEEQEYQQWLFQQWEDAA